MPSASKDQNTESARARFDRVKRARELRNNPTPAEKILWDALRKRGVEGRKFRRQCPLGPYFADFVCLSDRLIIELDGAHHDLPEQARHDRIRTIWLRRQRFRVLRFKNEEVLGELHIVRLTIAQALKDPSWLESVTANP